MADVTRLDRIGIPVWQAVRPASRNISVSQGKGVTAMAARVSAVMEAIELWHAETLEGVARTVASLAEMAFANPIPESSLRWLADGRRLRTAPIAWVRARPLQGGRDGWLPRDMLQVDFSLPDRLRPTMFLRTSNGLASGNCREEALLHALCELVERHGLWLARAEPARRVAIEPETVTGEPAHGLLARLRGAGKVALYDLTWEAGVPVVLAELACPDLPVVWRGSGCHPSPEVALARALTEAAQSRLTFISGARDDLPPLAAAQDPARAHRNYRPPATRRAFGELADLATADLGADVAATVARLAAIGIQPFVVDLTRADLGIPVCYAFAPGLRELAHG